MIAAILRAQWLSMRIGAGRGTVFHAAAATIWYGLWTFVAIAVFGVTSTAGGETLRRGLPLGFLAVFLYWQVVPVLSASMGSALDMRKLLVYPVPHARLFLVEVLLRLTAGAEMLLILAGGSAGLLANRAAGDSIRAAGVLAGVLLFIWFNVLLASGVRSLLERLLSRRHVREVLVFLILLLWMVPRLLVITGVRPAFAHGAGGVLRAASWPWGGAAWAAMPQPGAVAWEAYAALVCWCAAAAWFGRWQFERSLRFDAAAAQSFGSSPAPRGTALADRFYRLPGLLWRDPLAAIVEKELRSLARTPRFRMVFVMGFTFGLVVWLPLALHRESPESAMSPHFLTIVAVYALTLLGQVSYWNCFGFDGSAAQIYFAAPQPLAATLVGKNIACLIFVYLEVLIVTGVTAALRMTAGWPRVVETLVVVSVCALYMLALGNVSSVQYPRPLNPERVSQGGASGRFQALIFLFFPVALVPVVLAYVARFAFDSDLAFGVVLALAAAIGGVLYWVALDSAVSTAARRREALIRELSRGEGPVVSG
jgi:ABC-2 type transport system permease protein